MSSKVSLSGVNEIIADSISLQEGNAIVNLSDKLNKSEASNKKIHYDGMYILL